MRARFNRDRARLRTPASRRTVALFWSTELTWCFFFQAEDGIRAGHVTGVQTCALPILQDCVVATEFLREHARMGKRSGHNRSEERRVGKECRCRGAPCHYKRTRARG